MEKKLIVEGNEFMDKAAFGETISSYHLEAAISFEHCTAQSFEETNWVRILELYDWLSKVRPSDITEINRAVVVLKLHGSSAAFSALAKINDIKRAENYYLYQSLLGEIYANENDKNKAKTHFEMAIGLTQSEQEKKLLSEKIVTMLQ